MSWRLYVPLDSAQQEIRLLTIPPRPPQTRSQNSQGDGLASTDTSNKVVENETAKDGFIAQLRDMGFSSEVLQRALNECGDNNDLSVIVTWLVDHPELRDRASRTTSEDPSKQSATRTEHVSTQSQLPQSAGSKNAILSNMQQMMKSRWEEFDVTLDMITTHFMMETVSMKKNPSFVALSYTWGDPNMHLQREDRPIIVWADAICINQKDASERSKQVSLMRLIYQKANCVMVWTGLAADDSDRLMTPLVDIGKQALEAGILGVHGKEFQKTFHGYGGGVLTSKQRAIKEAVERISERVGLNFPFRALIHFASRRYWKRVWVIQEIAVARELMVLCGKQRISLSHLAAAKLFISLQTTTLFPKLGWKDFMDPIKGRFVDEMLTKGDDGILEIVGHRRRYQLQTGPRRSLFDLLNSICVGRGSGGSQRATDPRDLIYGVLAMASDFETLAITPDYTKETQGVFAEATRKLLRLGYMNILAWSQQPDRLNRIPGLPSWVSDFSKPILSPCNCDNHFDIFSASGKHRSASRASPIVSSIGHNILALTCFKVDEIQSLGEAWHGESGFDFTLAGAYLDSVERLCWLREPLQIDNPGCVVTADWREAPWRIPSGDQEMHASRSRGTEAMHHDFKELRTYMDRPGQIGDRTQLSESCKMYLLALEGQHNRRPFISSMGYIGLVPAQSKKGDVVCVVEEARMPFVFRRAGEVYQLVGEAYVYGIMDGEFMESGPLMEIFHCIAAPNLYLILFVVCASSVRAVHMHTGARSASAGLFNWLVG
ncbi:hypothetical protein G7Y89_g3769 [Cudoniella acicularis]|uniref:UBA domain-containing protein n=1 Tax=Cudoniella acicularis TaxID=354080 RepID=A0A8H4RSL7_9HELO|nr:hypothetical protein G7Y89_g3769 [Cudoniella acicularis]